MTDRGGLEGVVVAPSRMCFIDGQKGILLYGGYDIRDLAAHATYEEVAYLLLKGELPTRDQLAWFRERLQREASDYSEETGRVVDMLAAEGATPMEMLRTAVSSDSFDDSRKSSNSEEDNIAKAIGLIARMPMMVARYHRRRCGEEPVSADPELSLAA